MKKAKDAKSRKAAKDALDKENEIKAEAAASKLELEKLRKQEAESHK
jgi:hypothetical protein